MTVCEQRSAHLAILVSCALEPAWGAEISPVALPSKPVLWELEPLCCAKK